MTHTYLDFETSSEADIKKVGLAGYIAHPSTKVLFLWAAEGDADPTFHTPNAETGGRYVGILRDICLNVNARFVAFNADFEREVWTKILRLPNPSGGWEDAALRARMAGLTGKLGPDTKFLYMDGDEKADGKDLIRLFCKPRPDGSFATEQTHPAEWEKFLEYGRQDVIALRGLYAKIAKPFPMIPTEQKLVELDWKINNRGIPVDVKTAEMVRERAKLAKANILAEAKTFTGCENPNSVQQMLRFLKAEGYPFNSLSGAKVRAALTDPSVPDRAKTGLRFRQRLGRSSVAKLDALNLREVNGRIRFAYKFHGAHTGRWSGSGFQPQNMPRPIPAVADDYSAAVTALRLGYPLTPWGEELDVIASTLRAVIHASPGKHLVSGDASQIEVRVLGWLAGCEVLTDIFRTRKDPYKAFAAGWLHKSTDEVTKHERQTSKPAVLAAGFGTGPGQPKVDKFGDIILSGLRGYAQNMGIFLTESVAQDLIRTYRDIHWRVCKLWGDLEIAARDAIEAGETTQVGKLLVGGVAKRLLWIELPSGRRLNYPRPRSDRNGLSYWGVTGNVFHPKKLYGGLLTENVVQAVARDILAYGMMEADRQGFFLVGHTHDEALCEQTPGDGYTHERLCAILSTNPPWAPDIPLDAEGWSATYYQK